jgi:hypothetical protein
MASSMPAMKNSLNDKLNDAGAEAWRAVLTHPTDHQQPIRNSFCCGAVVLPYHAGTGLLHSYLLIATCAAAETPLPSEHQHTAVHLPTASCA